MSDPPRRFRVAARNAGRSSNGSPADRQPETARSWSPRSDKSRSTRDHQTREHVLALLTPCAKGNSGLFPFLPLSEAEMSRIPLPVDLLREAQDLQRSQTLLRMAGRLSRMGAWSVELPAFKVTLSDEVCAIHEMPPGFAPTVEEAIQFYAPEFRDGHHRGVRGLRARRHAVRRRAATHHGQGPARLGALDRRGRAGRRRPSSVACRERFRTSRSARRRKQRPGNWPSG